MVTVAAVAAVLGKNTVCEEPSGLNVDIERQGDAHLHSPLCTKIVHLDILTVVQ